MTKNPMMLIKSVAALVVYNALSFCMVHAGVEASKPAALSKKEKASLTIYRNGGFAKLEHPVMLDTSTYSCVIGGIPNSILKETWGASVGDANVNIVDYSFQPNTEKPQSLVLSLCGTPAVPQTHIKYQYAFKNISWNTSYAFHFSSHYQKVQLNSWLELKNQTDADFPPADLQFIDAPLPFSEDANTAEENISIPLKAGHTYFFPNLSPLTQKSTKYVNWCSAHDVSVKQDYRIFVGGPLLEDIGGKSATPPVETWISFSNEKEHGMGLPLPSGTAILSYEDSGGNVQILGKAHIPHTDSGQEVSVKIPNLSFDGNSSLGVKRLRSIETELTQTEYKKLDKTIEANYRLSIRSKAVTDAFDDKKPVTIRVALDFPEASEWVVVRENIGHQQNGSHQIYWIVQVAPGTDVDLKYRVRITR